jgi:hypothetical protein
MLENTNSSEVCQVITITFPSICNRESQNITQQQLSLLHKTEFNKNHIAVVLSDTGKSSSMDPKKIRELNTLTI